MGLFLSKLKDLFDDWGTSQARILMLGLDAAGTVFNINNNNIIFLILFILILLHLFTFDVET